MLTPGSYGGTGTTDKSVSANLTGLKANTTYHFRLVARNGTGTTNGEDKTFITLQDSTLLPEIVNKYHIFANQSSPLIINRGEYFKVFGSTSNIINIKSGGRVDCVNFVGANIVNIQDKSSDFKVYRSGATVYLKNATTGTLIKIPATSTIQKLRFADGSSSLIISSGKVKIGGQEIQLTTAQLTSPTDTTDTSITLF